MGKSLIRTWRRKAATGIGAAGAATALGVGLMTLAGGTAAADPPQANVWHHCPYEYVCIYPENENPITNSHVYPESGGEYWKAEIHALHDQYGDHYIVDNQAGLADDLEWKHCTLSTGNCSGMVAQHWNQKYGKVDLTPVNYIELV